MLARPRHPVARPIPHGVPAKPTPEFVRFSLFHQIGWILASKEDEKESIPEEESAA